MKRLSLAFLCLSFALAVSAADVVKLPEPASGKGTIDNSLKLRRSIRAYEPSAIPLRVLGHLLWAAQGVTDSKGHRTAPSAGATYPLELYAIAMDVDGLAAGVYHYRPKTHDLELVAAGDKRKAAVDATRGQQSIAQAPVVFVFAAVQSRTAARYSARAERYVGIETGAAAENLALEAAALGLGTCFVGAFDDAAIRGVVGLTTDEAPILVLPAGTPKR